MIKLTISETSEEDAINQRHQWPIQLTAVYSEDDSPAKIFVMHESPDTDVFADSLSCVASAIQMTDLPADAPAEGSPFYRLHTVTKLCRSALAAEEFKDGVKNAVQDLVNNLDAATKLSVSEEITYTPDS